MKDPYQVLRQKEKDVSLIRQQVEALRAVIPLLDEDGEQEGRNAERLAAGAESRIWNAGKKARDDKSPPEPT